MEENKKSYYAIIPAPVRYDNNLPPNAKLLYGEITALCNETGFCWAENEYFANLYGVSKASISGWVSKLKKAGYIDVEFEYKKGTKEILHRHIKIIEYPIQKKLNTPIQKNLKDNNTNINNTLNNTVYKDIVTQVIDYLNSKVGTHYKYTSKIAVKNIKARVNEGYKADDFIRVIDIKCSHWLNDEKMRDYLTPSTLFGTKFEVYLNQQPKQEKRSYNVY